MKTLIKLIVISCVLSFSINLLSAQKSKYDQLHIPGIKKSEVKLCHKYWCFVYSEEHEQAKWVAYKLSSDMVSGDEERTNKFKVDPLVTTFTANDNDYKSMGYDRGHLAPAADMSFDKNALEESFYYSNISPQLAGFNRGVWKKLETYVRNTAKMIDCVYVVTGPVLQNNLTQIGENGVAVPHKFYKTLLYFSDTLVSGIAFVMPNEKVVNTDIFHYACTIDELEKVTGIDFWPALPYFVEKKTEKKLDLDFWGKFAK